MGGLPANGALVVDGEIVAFEGARTRLGRLQQRLGVTRRGPDLPRKFPVCFCLLDVLYGGGDTRRARYGACVGWPRGASRS